MVGHGVINGSAKPQETSSDGGNKEVASGAANKFVSRTVSRRVNFGKARVWGKGIRSGMDERRAQ